MCSINENEFDEPVQYMETKKVVSLIGVMCKKCGQTAEVVLRVKDAYCSKCFYESFTHKFRATLGKSKMIKPNDNVLIGFCGSQSSSALLKLVKEGREITNPKRLRCIPHIVYIDEGAAYTLTEEQRHEIFKSISEVVLQYNIPGYVTSLYNVLDCDAKESVCYSIGKNTNLIINKEGDMKVTQLFSQIKSVTSKEDLLHKLRYSLLQKVAAYLDCNKVFVGDCATDLAVTIMSNISLGRGAHLALDVGFCDFRYKNVSILRPMRDFSKKEIAYYNVFNNVRTVHYPTFLTKVDSSSCIQRLTEKFIVDLQNDFPSTVSTIFRTGDKLSLEKIENKEYKTCALCKAPLDTLKEASSSLQATEFSQLVSSPQLPTKDSAKLDAAELAKPLNEDNCCASQQRCGCREDKQAHKWKYQEIKSYLCYGCRLIVKEMDSIDSLPAEVKKSMKMEDLEEQLRKQIEDYLL